MRNYYTYIEIHHLPLHPSKKCSGLLSWSSFQLGHDWNLTLKHNVRHTLSKSLYFSRCFKSAMIAPPPFWISLFPGISPSTNFSPNSNKLLETKILYVNVEPDIFRSDDPVLEFGYNDTFLKTILRNPWKRLTC